ncbi:MAG: protein phosphatase 2C domain-containing protein [Spirochaetaceae bacterium]|jgi:serine/threonine protein phosphatase PrpC|nr:protein phosphatase 2C domain-containing protein [Spirochaetaceae bacterium]
MVYKSFAASVVGSNHIKHGKDKEDRAGCLDNPKMSLAIVADGHGADECFRCATGAKIATECAIDALQDFINKLEPRFKEDFLRKASPPSRQEFDGMLRTLVKNIIARWHDEVDMDIKAKPFTAAELEKAGEKYRKKYEAGECLYKAYGTTLIAAAVTSHYWFGIHIGDGRFTALYRDGSFDQPVPWDEKCFLNQTTSICDEDAAERARVYHSFNSEKAPPAAIFLCSDGVDDNYPVEENEKYLFRLYRTIALTFAEEGFDSTTRQIKDLANSFASKGKGDDTSIAGMVDMDVIKQAAPIWRRQIAAEEQAAEKTL